MQKARKMNPFCIPFAITNMSSALLAMDIGFMGPNYSISTACATGDHGIFRSATPPLPPHPFPSPPFCAHVAGPCASLSLHTA